MHDNYYDHLTYDGWGRPRERVREADRLSHLVFVDGRLVDSWTEDVQESRYAHVARDYDEERRPQVVQSPPPEPRHVQALRWLDTVAGGREELLSMTASPVITPRLPDDFDPVVDEDWLVTDELLIDLRESLLTPDLAAPLRACLLLARERVPELAGRLGPARLAAGITWVVGKTNGAIGPEGPVTQLRIAHHLGVTTLNTCGTQVLGHVRRLSWPAPQPWGSDCPRLMSVGCVDLLSASVRRDLVSLRDDALAEEAAVLPSGVES